MISSSVPFADGQPRSRGLATTIAVALIASSAVLGLFVAGVTFGALAIAFQIAIPIAQQYAVSISAADMAVAARIGAFWWVFGAVSIAAFAGAGIAATKAIRYLDSPRQD